MRQKAARFFFIPKTSHLTSGLALLLLLSADPLLLGPLGTTLLLQVAAPVKTSAPQVEKEEEEEEKWERRGQNSQSCP